MSDGRQQPGMSYLPDYGEVVPRLAIQRLVSRVRPQVTVIVAPGGYGKSVAAAQLAASSTFRRVYWVHLGRECDSGSAMVHRVHDEIVLGARAAQAWGGGAPLEDLLAAIACRVSAECHEEVCLVLDDLQPGQTDELEALLTPLVRLGRPRVSVLITGRHPVPPIELRTEYVGPEMLRFDHEEIACALSQVGAECVGLDVIDRVVQASDGQAALVALLARHPDLAEAAVTGGHGMEGLRRLVRDLAASQLDSDQYLVLGLAAALGAGTRSDLASVSGVMELDSALSTASSVVPLLRVDDAAHPSSFRAHGVLSECIVDHEFVRGLHPATVRSAVALLSARGENARGLHLLLLSDDSDAIASALSAFGTDLIHRGGLELVRRALQVVEPQRMIQQPELMLVLAATEAASDQIAEARQHASIAVELAASRELPSLEAAALLLLIQTGAASAYEDTLSLLDRADGILEGVRDPNLRIAVYVHRVLAAAATSGSGMLFDQAEERMRDDLRVCDMETRLRVTHTLAVGKGLCVGDGAASIPPLRLVCSAPQASASLRLLAMNNLAFSQLEMGRQHAARASVARTVSECVRLGYCALARSATGTLTLLDMIDGDCAAHRRTISRLVDEQVRLGELVGAAADSSYAAVACLGCGAIDEAVALSEGGADLAYRTGFIPVVWLARLAQSSALLAVGDTSAAEDEARAVGDGARAAGARYHHLKADMVLAEIECRNGDYNAAAARFVPHVPYIRTESSNWQLAMYVRAFPNLLGPLAAAVGPDRLPAHMLRLIPPEQGDDALSAPATSAVLDAAARASLEKRLTGEAAKRRVPTPAPATEVCEVKLFGGLEVRTPRGLVEQRAWRKRKARLLFAMLASRCGRDVPRDQLLDYLWPELPQAAALNNLYVVWSSMKRALSPGLGRDDRCPFVENVGGVCRAVPDRVHTDLDEFENQIAIAAKARGAGDAQSELAALREVASIYRGDLLPAETYDDWFAPLRERCRHEFEDAMLRAGELLEQAGDVATALALVRRALEHDPWREDLYQAALRLQIAAGQRSAAIDTYLACRTRLVEDLGIDPSGETTRLYQHVLAMDEPTVAPNDGDR